MAFRLKDREHVGKGVVRNMSREVERALEHLRQGSAPRAKEASANDAVHEVRKCFKRVRAGLRLLRDELGDDLYHEENWCFRDAARPLTEVRDAVMLIETLDQLTPDLADKAAARHVREALVANQVDVSRRVLIDDQAFHAVTDMATRALARLADWRMQRDGWAALESGLRRVYREGHRALSLALEQPSVENLHEWRKQSKYHWHHLQLIEPALASKEGELPDDVHTLTQLLGEDHDRAVLQQTLATDPLSYGGQRALANLFALIERQRATLERNAFELGRRLYQDSPRVFISRLDLQWKEWTGSAMEHVSSSPGR